MNEFGKWMEDHRKKCKQCDKAFTDCESAVCDAAFDKLQEYLRTQQDQLKAKKE